MSTLLSIDGRRYARRRATGADPKCWRGLWLVERLDEPRDLVGTFRTAKEADAAAEEDARRAEVDTWERDQLDRAESETEARHERERAQAAADRRDAQQAASRGCLNCCWCGGENAYAAERCDWCKEDPMMPAEGLEEPPFARLHELSVEAIHRQGASGEAA